AVAADLPEGEDWEEAHARRERDARAWEGAPRHRARRDRCERAPGRARRARTETETEGQASAISRGRSAREAPPRPRGGDDAAPDCERRTARGQPGAHGPGGNRGEGARPPAARGDQQPAPGAHRRARRRSVVREESRRGHRCRVRWARLRLPRTAAADAEGAANAT